MHECLVIGGGIAGLAAGVKLAMGGIRVTLVEEKPHFGGRAYSFADGESGDIIDNGQHLIMGCYRAFLDFLQRIGSAAALQEIRPMRIPFRLPGGIHGTLRTARLPHPFGFIAAILRHDLLTRHERLDVLRLAARLRVLRTSELDSLDLISVHHWLQREKQSPAAMERLWNVICLATMNTDMRWASAKLFAVVLREIFFGPPGSSTLLLPAAGLSDLYVQDAVRSIRRFGGKCITHNGVRHLIWQGDKISGVVLRDGTLMETADVVLAIPPWKLDTILPMEWKSEIPFSTLDRFQPSEIRAYYVWSNSPITPERMTGLVGTRLQWIFSKGKSGENRWLYACVISAAGSAGADGAAQEWIEEELCSLYPSLEKGTIARVKRITERAATFSALPGLGAFRPGPRTPIRNAYLAGDWTDTGLPATLEGAVRSGYGAAEAVFSSMKGNADAPISLHNTARTHA